MNKNFKVIQINGLSGLLILGFLITGAFCGFVIFPIWIIMNVWNAIIIDVDGPIINYFQAALLWSAVVLSLYLLLKNSISIKLQKEELVDPSEIKDMINEIKEKEEQEK